MSILQRILTAVFLLAAIVLASPQGRRDGTYAMSKRQTTDRYVFCHFMIGIVADRTSSADYDADMQRAKSLGIDAFALNIGIDSYTDAQLNYAYESAANNNMKVFISFDFNWLVCFDRVTQPHRANNITFRWTTSQGTAVGQLIGK